MSGFSYRIVKGKYVITKGDGTYFAITRDQIDELDNLINDIKWGHGEYESKDNRIKKEVK